MAAIIFTVPDIGALTLAKAPVDAGLENRHPCMATGGG